MLAKKTLDALDMSVEKGDTWIREIMEETGWTSRKRATRALKAVLHVLRDHFTPDEERRFNEQLPVVVWQLFNENPQQGGLPAADFPDNNAHELYRQLIDEIENPENRLMVMQVILNIINRHVEETEVNHWLSILNGKLRTEVTA
ncbi:MAG: DUF2267 domain-containing protein [Chitinivibrionales bacterium]|nr:DUF2267 domain-containing protein [Chitinivibrionales bacterium]